MNSIFYNHKKFLVSKNIIVKKIYGSSILSNIEEENYIFNEYYSLRKGIYFLDFKSNIDFNVLNHSFKLFLKLPNSIIYYKMLKVKSINTPIVIGLISKDSTFLFLYSIIFHQCLLQNRWAHL